MTDELISRPELDAQQRAVILALQKGCTRTAAAAYAGVSRQTFYAWLAQIPLFASVVEMAEGTAEVGHTEVLAKAGLTGDWRASLEWLKRRRREEWGDNTTVTVDKRASELIAALFPADAETDSGEAGDRAAKTGES